MPKYSKKFRYSIFLLFMAVFGSACAAPVQTSCEKGELALQASQFSMAVSELTKCLNNQNLDSASRRRALQVRAWAHFSLRQNNAAVQDQEASFVEAPPTDYREFINYSSYLRRVSRFEDSLSALKAAESINRRSGLRSMMTQYNLGWTLTELRRYDEAAKVLTDAIPLQPEFPFVYWRRALVFEALGRNSEAKRDIESAAKLMTTGPMKFSEDEFTIALRKKIQQYNLQKQYPM
jgi:tetratricopeptide (TPR) repeat protein